MGKVNCLEHPNVQNKPIHGALHEEKTWNTFDLWVPQQRAKLGKVSTSHSLPEDQKRTISIGCYFFPLKKKKSFHQPPPNTRCQNIMRFCALYRFYE